MMPKALHLNFPPCGANPDIAKDPDGDKTLVHVQDSAGNDFEVRCHRGWTSFNYEFWVSFPDGSRSKVDECELYGGLNDVVLHITGGSTPPTKGANGGDVIQVGGVISKYYHHNLNGSRDFHTIYDYAKKTSVRIDTKRGTNPDGSKYDIFFQVAGFVPTIVPRLEQPSTVAHKGDVAILDDSGCRAGEVDESQTIAETAVRGTPSGAVHIYHPMSTRFRSVRWDAERGAIRFEFAVRNRPREASIAIPKSLVAPETRLSRVFTDESAVAAIETISPDYRTLTFEIPKSTNVVWVE
jgi:hypothetical protein